VDEVFTVAVPVFDYRGSVTAALSVTGPSGRLSEERLLEFAPRALMAAKNLSVMLGFVEKKDDPSPSLLPD
jgi:DNA-binding IclR family transcriptional regulator